MCTYRRVGGLEARRGARRCLRRRLRTLRSSYIQCVNFGKSRASFLSCSVFLWLVHIVCVPWCFVSCYNNGCRLSEDNKVTVSLCCETCEHSTSFLARTHEITYNLVIILEIECFTMPCYYEGLSTKDCLRRFIISLWQTFERQFNILLQTLKLWQDT